ncbi:hypothetical protein KSS87_017292 [Heliosperma pusillum]|nr:hypothetical protein KSS87_017292 [Heliosperma pusillum]
MLKICERAFSDPIKYLCDLQSFLTRGREIPKTVYYRVQFRLFGRSYWVILGHVSFSHDFGTTHFGAGVANY